jgi:hypothetical protein
MHHCCISFSTTLWLYCWQRGYGVIADVRNMRQLLHSKRQIIPKHISHTVMHHCCISFSTTLWLYCWQRGYGVIADVRNMRQLLHSKRQVIPKHISHTVMHHCCISFSTTLWLYCWQRGYGVIAYVRNMRQLLHSKRQVIPTHRATEGGVHRITCPVITTTQAPHVSSTYRSTLTHCVTVEASSCMSIEQ